MNPRKVSTPAKSCVSENASGLIVSTTMAWMAPAAYLKGDDAALSGAAIRGAKLYTEAIDPSDVSPVFLTESEVDELLAFLDSPTAPAIGSAWPVQVQDTCHPGPLQSRVRFHTRK